MSATANPAFKEVARMPLSRFARSGLAVFIRSEVLGERIVLAADGVRIPPTEARAVYRVAEVRKLLGLSPGDLRKVHETKMLFDGAVVG